MLEPPSPSRVNPYEHLIAKSPEFTWEKSATQTTTAYLGYEDYGSPEDQLSYDRREYSLQRALESERNGAIVNPSSTPNHPTAI